MTESLTQKSEAKSSDAPRFTSGPWVAEASKSGLYGSHDYLGVWATRSNGSRVRIADCASHVAGRGPEDSANARLVAAAPDLYEAFERLCAIALNHGSGEVPDATVGKVAKAIAREYGARAAISKVRGGK